MIRVNLLPVREVRRRAAGVRQLMLMFLAALIAAGGSAGFHAWHSAKESRAKLRVAETEKQIERYKPQMAQMRQFREKKDAVESKLKVIRGLDASRSGPVRMLDELATHTPKRLWITQLDTVDREISLTGRSLDNEIIAQFLTFVNKSPFFTDVQLEKTELQELAGIKLNVFSIKASLDTPGLEEIEKQKSSETAKEAAAVPAADDGSAGSS